MNLRNLRKTFSFSSIRKLTLDIVVMALAYGACFLLRFDFRVPTAELHRFWVTLPIVLGVKLLVFGATGVFRRWWRYFGMNDVFEICKAGLLSEFIIAIAVLQFRGYPRSLIALDLVLTIGALSGLRFAPRFYVEASHKHSNRKRALVVGAGVAGRKLVNELKTNPELHLQPLGFIDDDPRKRDLKIEGIAVLGGVEELPRLISEKAIEIVLVAMPSAAKQSVWGIVQKCREHNLELKILPSVAERINGNGVMQGVRNVRLEDLLGRQPVSLDVQNLTQQFRNRVLMVTGAGGSIGSELCRQLAPYDPAALVLFERSENDLHRIHIELATREPNLKQFPVIGDILDVNRLRQTMGDYRPVFVFHAAAYKHVPMMECNCFQAVTNNIFGTYNAAVVAQQYGVEKFLMISSDKAVNPTNIMGVTKRVAELVILAVQQSSKTCYTSVRFGNVLGSNGSVVPLFERQIAAGGPVTVTHPEACRYFMTIPEAAQLVLQASIMGSGGEVFVLDMGEPIRIADLARNLIRLSGFEPDREIKIVYTGLRPGEKLYEEFQLKNESIKPTPHRQINVFDGGTIELARAHKWLEDLSVLVEASSVPGLISKLKEIVPEYLPSQQIRFLSGIDRHHFAIAYAGQAGPRVSARGISLQ